MPGTIQLLANASGTYATGTINWLISNTIDFGTSTANYISLNVNPAVEPTSTGAGSAAFQLAANNDDVTWNFVGPDGTGNTYYTASSTIVNLGGDRYFRYKVFLSTQDPTTSPSVNDVTIGFSSQCVPQYQTLFSGLSSGSYLLTVSAPNYIQATSSVTISANAQATTVDLTHQ